MCLLSNVQLPVLWFYSHLGDCLIVCVLWLPVCDYNVCRRRGAEIIHDKRDVNQQLTRPPTLHFFSKGPIWAGHHSVHIITHRYLRFTKGSP